MNLETSAEEHYDLILIGSGIGALTVASVMAQLRNKKILVIERHFKAGGFTHDFKRKNFHWDVGVHYVGVMGKDCWERAIMDLITGGKVEWARLPDPMDVFIYPDFRFPVYGNRNRYQADLIDRFPQEASAIRQYFRDLETIYAHGYPGRMMKQCRAFPMPLIGTLEGLFHRSWVKWTVKDYLDHRFKHPELKAILASQWGTVGLPPGQCVFPVFATVMNHYVDGAYYPIGGAGTIADSVQHIVTAKGGKFLLNREVTQVLIENNRAVGVQVRNKAGKETVEHYFASTIVSDAGAATTYLKLIPPEYPVPFRESLRHFVEQNEPTTSVGVYLGLSQDPRTLGFQGENYWIYNTLDHDNTYQQRGKWVDQVQPVQAYVSFPSLKDPQATRHTATIHAWTDYNIFSKWQEQPWRHRDEEYQVLKHRLMDALIQFVDQRLPGFAGLIEYKEFSTPITNEHFTGHYHGGIYGLPAIPERFRPENLAWTRPTTVLPGLYLTGADVYCLGVVGAMMSATYTLGELPGGIFLPELKAAALARKQSLLSD